MVDLPSGFGSGAATGEAVRRDAPPVALHSSYGFLRPATCKLSLRLWVL
jgi:hypothetical protein